MLDRSGPDAASRGLLVRHATANAGNLLLRCSPAHFEKDPQWWFGFVYRTERERGQDFTEDLWTPGFFKCRIEAPARIVLWASLHPHTPGSSHDNSVETDIDVLCNDLRQHQEDLSLQAQKASGGSLKAEGFGDGQCQASHPQPIREAQGSAAPGAATHRESSIESQASGILYAAADQFVVKRQTNGGYRTTILAGYPWFADWGRDALIALPGLLLATGKFDEAKAVLTTFAAAADEGMIPNCFDERSDTAHFNSVDASLWFADAAFQYLEATGDSTTFTQELLPTIRWIIDSYSKGTRFGIRADADGLIMAGDENTQLTWMDAKCDGIAFTPRYGKAVEVNALWYNALMLMGTLERGGAKPNPAIPDAAKVQGSFCELFWNEDKGYLNDCILPDGSADQSLRPNQIFAVSL